MKAVFRSLATVVLAATVPILVFGGPRGGGAACAVFIQVFLQQLENCNNDETPPPPPPAPGPSCTVAGDSECTYDVRYVNSEGRIDNIERTASEDGVLTVFNCKSIQKKTCLECFLENGCPGE